MDLKAVEAMYPVGKKLTVTIMKVDSFGAFVTNMSEGVTGYIPARELSWGRNIPDARNIVSNGDNLEVLVVKIEPNSLFVFLSPREAKGKPWNEFCMKHKKGDIVKVRVTSVFKDTAFFRTEEEIEGVIYIADIYPMVNNLKEVLMVEDIVKAVISDFEQDENENRVRLSVADLFKEDELVEKYVQPILTLGEAAEDTFTVFNYNENKDVKRDFEFTPMAVERLKNILVVETDLELAISASQLLEGAGFNVDYACSVDEVRSKLDTQIYNLALVSTSIDGTNGVDFAKNVLIKKTDVEYIFMYDGIDINEYTDALKNMGLKSHVLLKPYSLRDLVKVINDNAESITPFYMEGCSKSTKSVFIEKLSTTLGESQGSGREIKDILSEIKEETKASFAVVFRLHLTTQEAEVYQHIDMEKDLNAKERGFLRFSPVEDVIYKRESIWTGNATGNKYKHLKPVGEFKSVVGIKIPFSSDYGYGFFIFGREEGQFGEEEFKKAQSTAMALSAAIERRTIEEVYKAQHKFLISGRLSASMVHELKNEQQKISNSIEKLKDYSVNINAGKLDPKDTSFLANYQKYVNRLLEAQNRIQTIEELFLNLLKSRSEKDVNLKYHLAELVAIYEPLAKKKNIEIIPPESRTKSCRMDVGMLDQVVTNVLLNAIEFIPTIRKKSGKIWIETEFIENDLLPLKFRIKDNGPGIHEAHRAKVFDMFFTTRNGGAGLGLYICKEIINSMGGKISIEESIRFEGTTFLIELPINK